MNKIVWFKRAGWFHSPVSWQGGFLVVMAVAFCVQVFLAVDRHSHSVSDTFYGVFPYFACAFLLLNWVAANTCGTASGTVRPVEEEAGYQPPL